MAAEYINRKGQAHYLKSVPTKKGKERYYIVKNKSKVKPDELLLEVPRGFEFYEFPEDARVVIRKIPNSIINSEEMSIVDLVMKEHETAKDYILDKDENGITVYLANLSKEDFNESEEHFKLIQSYTAKLRFEKARRNLYKAQRFCYLSQYYGWITMESSNDLGYLAEKYCYHIDKESLLDFWIEGEEDW